MYDHVDLFSGLGCWALAARANGLRTVAFCEREEWLAAGLERTWGVPCHRDVKTFPAKDYAGRVWLLTGSPPCQPVSCAGKRRGKADDRWIWGPTVSVCEVIQPAWFIFENPPGLDGVGLDGIISDLERLQYEVATLRIPACAVNSPQLRDRFWIVGNAIGKSMRRQPGDAGQEQPPAQRDAASGALADGGCRTHSGSIQRELAAGIETEPRIKGVTLANGDGTSLESGKGLSGAWRPPILPSDDPWRDYEWIPFNGAVYRAPVGLYELADESTVVIPKRFRAKLISALGNCIVWPVAANLIKAIKASDHRRPNSPTVSRKSTLNPQKTPPSTV